MRKRLKPVSNFDRAERKQTLWQGNRFDKYHQLASTHRKAKYKAHRTANKVEETRFSLQAFSR